MIGSYVMIIGEIIMTLLNSSFVGRFVWSDLLVVVDYFIRLAEFVTESTLWNLVESCSLWNLVHLFTTVVPPNTVAHFKSQIGFF